jgi:hypothetical protein
MEPLRIMPDALSLPHIPIYMPVHVTTDGNSPAVMNNNRQLHKITKILLGIMSNRWLLLKTAS